MAETPENIPTQDNATTLEQEASAQAEGFEISVLPLQNTTLFPGTIVPLAVGRPRSVAAVEAALSTEEKLLCCISARRDDVTGSDAAPADLYEVGTLVMIKRMMRDADSGTLQLIVQGTERVHVLGWTQEQPFMRARVHILPPPRTEDPEEVEATRRNVQALVQQALALLPQVPPEVRMAVMGANDPVQLAYFLGSVLDLGVEQEQKMLEAETTDELLRHAYGLLAREVEIMELRSKIATEAQTEMNKAQRDYILRQQIKAIQKELGEDEGGERAEADLLRERL